MIVESFSGIRGIYNPALLDLARKYAQAYSLFLNQNRKNKKEEEKEKNIRIVIGMDTRPSSKNIFEEMSRILINEGAEVFFAGYMPVPAVELGVPLLNADGGIMITASHNPPEYNGWKLLRNDGAILNPESAEWVINKAHTLNSKSTSIKSTNTKSINKTQDFIDKSKEIKNHYLEYLLNRVRDVELDSKQKIIFDPNGGAAITVLPELVKKLGIDGVIINKELGKFNRIIEPTGKSLSYLKKILEENDAELAFGYDCDSDRVEIMLKNGDIVTGNQVLALILDHELKNMPKGIVVTNDATSGIVGEIVNKHGARLEEVEVGEINVVNKMEELNAVLGGEGSCAGIIMTPGKCRDGLLTTVEIIKILSKTGMHLGKLINDLPKYYNKQLRIRIDPSESTRAINKIVEHFKNKDCDVQQRGKQGESIKLVFKDGSFLFFRQSKTEHGLFRIIADSKSQKRTLELLDIGKELIN